MKDRAIMKRCNTIRPGRVVQVTRVSKARMIKEFRARQQIASALEVNHLLVPPAKPKRPTNKNEDKESNGEFKIGSRVEVYRSDSGEHWPATVTAINDNESVQFLTNLNDLFFSMM